MSRLPVHICDISLSANPLKVTFAIPGSEFFSGVVSFVDLLGVALQDQIRLPVLVDCCLSGSVVCYAQIYSKAIFFTVFSVRPEEYMVFLYVRPVFILFMIQYATQETSVVFWLDDTISIFQLLLLSDPLPVPTIFVLFPDKQGSQRSARG